MIFCFFLIIFLERCLVFLNFLRYLLSFFGQQFLISRFFFFKHLSLLLLHLISLLLVRLDNFDLRFIEFFLEFLLKLVNFVLLLPVIISLFGTELFHSILNFLINKILNVDIHLNGKNLQEIFKLAWHSLDYERVIFKASGHLLVDLVVERFYLCSSFTLFIFLQSHGLLESVVVFSQDFIH